MAAAEQVAEGTRRVLAPNPSAFTQNGTNSYILGEGRVAVVDPGPARPAHLEALLAALAPGEVVEAILVTHAHLDHTGLVPALKAATGAPVYAAGRATDGRSALMEALAASGLSGGGEGLDLDFVPDEMLTDGASLSGESWRVEALATPGHMATHMAFATGAALLSGDHVMGWSTSIVSPPDGDMGAYMASLARLAARSDTLYLPGHGPAISDPAARLAELIAHRRMREAAISTALGGSPRTARDLAREIYTDISPSLLPAAERNVFAHLIDLAERGRAAPDGPFGVTTGFARGPDAR